MAIKFTWNDKTILANLKTAQESTMAEACQFLAEEVKGSMVEGDYRPWRSKKGDGSVHWSSKPGTPPAPDTEELKDSISWTTSSGQSSLSPTISTPPADKASVEGRVGTSNEKGVRHELGLTIRGVQRAFLQPALEENTKQILDIFRKRKI